MNVINAMKEMKERREIFLFFHFSFIQYWNGPFYFKFDIQQIDNNRNENIENYHVHDIIVKARFFFAVYVLRSSFLLAKQEDISI